MHNFWPTQWEHAEVLWGLVALPLLAYLLWYDCIIKRRTARRWSQVPYVLKHSLLPSAWTEAWQAVLLLSSFTLAMLGFASPTSHTVVWEPTWERVAVGLLLDVSRSMRAAVGPDNTGSISRLNLLKQAVQELIEQLPSGVRIGVIAFAGVAVPIVPEPSADHQAVLAKVRRLNAEFIRNPGTDLTAAVQQGMAMFVDSAQDKQPDTVALILLSDGDTAVTPSLRKVVAHAPLPIYTLGIGVLQPTSIPDAQSPSGFMVNRRGVPLTTAVNESLLRFIANQTGGAYSPFTARKALSHTLRQIVARQSRQVMQSVSRPRSLRRICFLASLGCLWLYLFQTRTRWVKQR